MATAISTDLAAVIGMAPAALTPWREGLWHIADSEWAHCHWDPQAARLCLKLAAAQWSVGANSPRLFWPGVWLVFEHVHGQEGPVKQAFGRIREGGWRVAGERASPTLAWPLQGVPNPADSHGTPRLHWQIELAQGDSLQWRCERVEAWRPTDSEAKAWLHC